MKSIGFAVLAILLVTQNKAGDLAPANPQPTQSAAAAPTIQNASGSSAATPSSADERIKALSDRIQKLEDSKTSGWAVAIIGALAVLLSAGMGMLGQRYTARNEDRRSSIAAEKAAELARQEALYKHTEKILEFRLKQMEEFYAPMFALLGQSEGLYKKMRLQLIQDEPTQYRWTPDTEPKDGRMQVLNKAGQWESWRLLDQFPAVKKNPRALALADQVLKIGEQITQIISQHAGLASQDLMTVLGEYLAHYAILTATRKEDRDEPYPAASHQMGYYPRELNAKIIAGYKEVMQLVESYTAASKTLVQQFAQANSK